MPIIINTRTSSAIMRDDGSTLFIARPKRDCPIGDALEYLDRAGEDIGLVLHRDADRFSPFCVEHGGIPDTAQIVIVKGSARPALPDQFRGEVLHVHDDRRHNGQIGVVATSAHSLAPESSGAEYMSGLEQEIMAAIKERLAS